MALAAALPGMIADFTALLVGPPLGPIAGAAKMANIYSKYTKAGQFGLSLPIFTGLEEQVLAATLAAVFVLPVPNPAAWGTAWSLGLTTYWLAPPIAVAGPQVGAVTTFTGGPGVLAALTAQVLIPFSPPPVAATLIATALHVASLTVIATVAPPPSAMVPLL